MICSWCERRYGPSRISLPTVLRFMPKSIKDLYIGHKKRRMHDSNTIKECHVCTSKREDLILSQLEGTVTYEQKRAVYGHSPLFP